MDPRDLARDTSGTRAYADFLVELAARVPTQIIPNISVLLCHLNGEVCEKMFVLFSFSFLFFFPRVDMSPSFESPPPHSPRRSATHALPSCTQSYQLQDM